MGSLNYYAAAHTIPMVASTATSKRLQEAHRISDRAEGLCQKGLFHWFPDYDRAAGLFEKAGSIMQEADAPSFDIVQCFTRAGQCYLKHSNWILAAKNLVLAADCAIKGSSGQQAVPLYEQAASTYAKAKLPDMAAQCYHKAGMALIRPSNSSLQNTEHVRLNYPSLDPDLCTRHDPSTTLEPETIQKAMSYFHKVSRILEKERKEMIYRSYYDEMIAVLVDSRCLQEAQKICKIAMEGASAHGRPLEWSQYLFSILVIMSFQSALGRQNGSSLHPFLETFLKARISGQCPNSVIQCMSDWVEGIGNKDTRKLASCLALQNYFPQQVSTIYLFIF